MTFRIKKTLTDRQMIKAKFSCGMGLVFGLFLIGKQNLYNEVRADGNLWYN
jgi:hypothetical protein